MHRWLFATVLVAAATLAACADGSNPGGASCVDDSTCPTGTVCVNGACTISACNSSADCESNQVCVNYNGSQVCKGAECGCLTCAACPSGETCQEGSCVPETNCPGGKCVGDPCNDDSDCDAATQECIDFACAPKVSTGCDPACTGTDVCDDGTCRACEGDECGSTDCTVDGCESGFDCNTETGQCEPSATGSGMCASCTKTEDCGGGGWDCIPIGGAQACLPPCGTGDDCPTGYTCWSGRCAPSGFSCSGCPADGCPDGQLCDTNSGSCVTSVKGQCDECEYDWECGEAGACHKIGAKRYCVPRCTGGAQCPAGSACEADPDSQVQVCSPTASTCCFDANPANCGGGDDCGGTCGGATPYCKLGACVQCTQDSECGADETCNQSTWTCETTEGCQDPTPIFSPDDGKCVQCTDDSHCGGGTCDLVTKTCDGDVCSTCQAPYPACALVQGDYYCVQCTSDDHCGQGGTCNQTSYSCEGGTVTPVDACQSDADCDAGVSGFDLYCHPDGYCVDKTGQCDDITAYCIGGNECVDFFTQFIGESIPLPPELTGGSGQTLAGACECVPDVELIPGLGGPSADCPEGLTCSQGLFALLTTLLGGGTGLPSTYTCQSGDLGFP